MLSRQCRIVLLKWCLGSGATEVAKGSLMQVIMGSATALSLHFRSTTQHGPHAENTKEAE